MQFEGALVREQGITFAIVVVKPHILNSSTQADAMAGNFQPAFPGVPIVLMAQNGRGVPSYRGRGDLVNFLSRVPMHAIPWQRYTLN